MGLAVAVVLEQVLHSDLVNSKAFILLYKQNKCVVMVHDKVHGCNGLLKALGNPRSLRHRRDDLLDLFQLLARVLL